MSELLSYTFIHNALLAALLSGVCCGIIGTYMVSRRLVFMGGGITHSSLGGIGLAYWAGFDTTVGALIFAVASAFGIDYLSSSSRNHKKIQTSEDSATSIVWSAGMALGIIFIFLTPGYAPNLMTFLFGNLLLVTTSQIWWLFAFDLVLISVMLLFARTIIYTAADSGYAASQRTPVRAINIFMLILLAIAIVLNIRTLGIMLMISMLTIPVLIARLFTHSYIKIAVTSSILATASAIVGLIISYLYNVPSSATSVLVLVAALLFGFISKRLLRLFR